MNPATAVLATSKHGDLVNLGPIFKHLHDSGNTPTVIANFNFFSTLKGFSYVKIDAVHFPMSRNDLALEYAKNNYSTVLNAVTFGKSWKGPRDVPYNVLAWQNVGYGEHFDNTKDFPLIFDRRDAERESFLVTQHRRGNRPLVLLSVGCSRSSPFATHGAFSEAIRRKHGHYCEILDLCSVKAARLYDLLGLFDVATVLITADTSALHLATASPALKVVALTNDKPFLSSSPRCNVIYRTTYNQVSDKMNEIHAALRKAFAEGRGVVGTSQTHETLGVTSLA